ncbi:translation initiation factor IF-3 [Candidatus Roizmanbacteria bacterium CG10_big_fil_rev_8_21_14_0_10_39_6]|uniref:Translation initiation factor IF-3 n=1 Tax=Candidatus Roizmanbacteria bacterium CG10_big_fil_rev_8_21_14_0_10_39_6 TaxID=1974853 RepID=A0A2M8KTN1_9BACT|nr:MAG: translation initiation factor IF-3 [Candidatus Roizmanbacteria bacterium CG10_big_fil_rev_8_21_14_0_10_39_6]
MRILSADNVQIGVLTRLEALALAKEKGVDLVEVAPKAMPPVAKLIEFNKYLYQLAKKEKSELKGRTEVKEVKIGLFMAENDLGRMVKRVQDFLKKNQQVKVSLWLKGRQLDKKQEARVLMNGFIERVSFAKIVSEPVMQGKVMRAVITFDKDKKNEKAQSNKIEKTKD